MNVLTNALTACAENKTNTTRLGERGIGGEMDVQGGSSTGYHAMHKLGQCGWPIWRVDDFTNCFQREYVDAVPNP